MRQKSLERRHRDRLVSTFLPKHVKQYSGGRPAIRMSIEVHHVVEVAVSRPFSERGHFFAERNLKSQPLLSVNRSSVEQLNPTYPASAPALVALAPCHDHSRSAAVST